MRGRRVQASASQPASEHEVLGCSSTFLFARVDVVAARPSTAAGRSLAALQIGQALFEEIDMECKIRRSVRRGAALRFLFCMLMGIALDAQSAVRSWGGQWSDSDAREGFFVHVDASTYSSAVVREDGRILTYGASSAFWGETFSVPAGLRYLKVAPPAQFTIQVAFLLGAFVEGGIPAQGIPCGRTETYAVTPALYIDY